MTRRKLKLLSEILPDPRASKPAGPTPRERTARRLQQLLSIAAAGVLSAPGCGSESSSSGYMVVDPMPTPVCSMPPNDLTVNTHWERLQVKDMERDVIHIEVTAGATTRFSPPAPQIHGAEIVTVSITGQSLVMVVVPDRNSSGVSINTTVNRANAPAEVAWFLQHDGHGGDIVVHQRYCEY